MTLVKCQPNRSLVTFPAFNKIFDDFFPGFTGSPESPSMTMRPSVDVLETDDKVVLKADMPGLDKDGIKVVVDDGLLTISGTRKTEQTDENNGTVRSERFVGSFRRSFNLPTWADSSKVGANYTNGVLEVTIPKTEAAKPKEVEIQIN